MPSAELRPAAFLDRDGTVIREKHYLSDPEGVELLPGAAEGLGRLAARFALVIVSNQSGIARGLFTARQREAVQRRVEELLAAEGIRLAGEYHCPHNPELTGPCDCRKPGTALHRRAAAELRLDLHRSIYVGDRLSDVEPAAVLGGRAFLVRTGYGAEEAARAPEWVRVVPDLDAVADALEAPPPAREP